MGKVDRPGTYAVPRSGVTVLQAMANSALKSDHPTTLVITLLHRNSAGKASIGKIAFKSLLEDPSADIQIQPGDVLVVGENELPAPNDAIERLKQLEVQHSTLEGRLTMLRANDPGENNPSVRQVQQQLQEIEKQINELKANR